MREPVSRYFLIRIGMNRLGPSSLIAMAEVHSSVVKRFRSKYEAEHSASTQSDERRA